MIPALWRTQRDTLAAEREAEREREREREIEGESERERERERETPLFALSGCVCGDDGMHS